VFAVRLGQAHGNGGYFPCVFAKAQDIDYFFPFSTGCGSSVKKIT
jgi:hypothetical protein